MTVASLLQLSLPERARFLNDLTRRLVDAIQMAPLTEDEVLNAVSRDSGVYKDDILVALSCLDVVEDAEGHLRLV